MPSANRGMLLKRQRKFEKTGESLMSSFSPTVRALKKAFVATSKRSLALDSFLKALSLAENVKPSPKKSLINFKQMSVMLFPPSDPELKEMYTALARVIQTTNLRRVAG